MNRRLPVILPPIADELLSSWINRHAAFYAVPPLGMLRHCLPEVPALRAADLHLRSDQVVRLADMFVTEPAVVHRMTFSNVARSSHRLIASRRTQVCSKCGPGHSAPETILRSQLSGWRITCQSCGNLLLEPGGRERPSPFSHYHAAAVRGEKLIDDEAEHGIETWTSPIDIARLLLMRRTPRPIPSEHDLWRFRVLGVIIPDLDQVIATERENLPTPARPILPLHMRPALLAGVAIVERAGPEMLRMLHGHMMGENGNRFAGAAERMITRASNWRTLPQLHLI